jgi:2-methylcitrate dehydratase PrpD
MTGGTTEGRGYAAIWSEFVADLRFADLPADVVHRMKRSLLDMIGVGLTGSRDLSAQLLVGYLREQGGTREATVFPGGLRTTAVNAALANATQVHATELAESFTRATMHVGNAVPPAALAVAEKQHAGGKELITAMAIGYEIAIRCGLAIRVDPLSSTFAAKPETRPEYNVFSHPVATFGIYGAAAASAHLLRLDTDRARHALTLGTSIAPAIGLQLGVRGFKDGGMGKDLNQGFANALGVMSAELASRGVTGPPDVTNHFAALVGDFAPELLVRDLGAKYLISSGGLHFKIHKTAGMTQETADALLAVLATRPIDPRQVERIRVFVNNRGVRMCADPDPPDGVAAKLSIPYVASAILSYQDELKGDPHFTGLYTDSKVSDPARRDLARRVEVIGVDEYDRYFELDWPMQIRGRVEVLLKSGETARGEAEIWSVTSRLTDQQVIDKFSDLAGRVLPSERVAKTVDLVFELDRLEDLDGLVRTVCFEP